jgi:hypothetical protein
MEFTRILIHCFLREGRLAESIDGSASLQHQLAQGRTTTEKDHSALIPYALITRSVIVSLSVYPLLILFWSQVGGWSWATSWTCTFTIAPFPGGVVFARSMTVASPPFSDTYTGTYDVLQFILPIHDRRPSTTVGPLCHIDPRQIRLLACQIASRSLGD